MFLKIRNTFCGLRSIRLMSNQCLEIEKVAAGIVKEYLVGQWKEAHPSNIVVKKLKGGLSNWLYQITLSIPNQKDNLNPKSVLLRFYEPTFREITSEHDVNDLLISLLVSERKLGPQLYGVFPGGRIEEYIHARPLKTKELESSKFAVVIARKMAEVHSLNVPISKNPETLFDIMLKWIAELDKNWSTYDSKNIHHKDTMAKFKSYNLNSEIIWLRQHLNKLNSPIVFCHNDLQEGNILVTHNSVNSDRPDLVLIDYEYCSYNHRGFDLANHFLEYTINYEITDYPHFMIDPQAYPTIEQQVNFIRVYLTAYNSVAGTKKYKSDGNGISQFNEFIKLKNLNITNEEAHLLMEISNCRLLSHLFWGVWAAAFSQCTHTFGYWDYALARLNGYFETKEEILNVKNMN